MNAPPYKRFLFIGGFIAAGIVLVAAIYFLLIRGVPEQEALPPIVESSGEKKETPAEPQQEPTQAQENLPSAVSVPPYRGRNPAEFRPIEKHTAGFSKKQIDDLRSELEQLAQGVKDQPDVLSPWLQIGLIKKAIGDFEGSRDAWEYASIIRPESFIPAANLAQILWRDLGDVARAERYFREAIRRDPANPSLYAGLSEFYVFGPTPRLDLAARVLQEGLGKKPNDLGLLKALGDLYERQENYAQALEWWKKALTLDPKNPAMQEKVSELAKKAGT